MSASGSNGGKTVPSSRSPRCLGRCQPSFFQKDEPLQVVACRFEAQRESGAQDAQASHEFSAHLRQRAEHMFDMGARGIDTAVAPFLRDRNTFVGVAPSLNVDLPSCLFECAFSLSAG